MTNLLPKLIVTGLYLLLSLRLQASDTKADKAEALYSHIAKRIIAAAVNKPDQIIVPRPPMLVPGLFSERLALGWTYQEKREFAVLIMVSFPLDGEIAKNFKDMLGKDSRQIGIDLSNIDGNNLVSIIHGHQSSVESFKLICNYLQK